MTANVAAAKVYFAYGWSEGPWQSRRMRRLLTGEGFTITKDAAEANVIVAHSLGCYLIPREQQAKLVLMIGLPYWPGRPIWWSVLKNIAGNIRNSSLTKDGRWWIAKLAHNIWYILTRPQDSYYAFTVRQSDRLPKASQHRKIILIRNHDDTFSHPEAVKQLAAEKHYDYRDIPVRHHEDCWLRPEPYIELIKQHYG